MSAILKLPEMPLECIDCPCEYDETCRVLDGLDIVRGTRRMDCPLQDDSHVALVAKIKELEGTIIYLTVERTEQLLKKE
jgi:hypothetical protein